MTGLMTDLRFALRMLAAKPAHTLAIVLTLAIAIGGNASIFSVVEAVRYVAGQLGHGVEPGSPRVPCCTRASAPAPQPVSAH